MIDYSFIFKTDSRPSVLVACEKSGIVREAFRLKGFNAWSCDIQPTDIPGNHIQDDVSKLLQLPWSLIIAHPPCPYLSFVCRSKWPDIDRVANRLRAASFFMQFFNTPCKFICVENPNGVMTNIFRPPDQIIHPYYFGDNEMKRTCLWLVNLPPLPYSLHPELFSDNPVYPHPHPDRIYHRFKNGKPKKIYFVDRVPHNQELRSSIRSQTFPGVATAMADAWAPIFV
ncbi:MAG: hypothetical protein A2W17_06255 [Planctomycetes bacterium RBG_16_41_13]|nr:MAG: hypothetical protein A2W17_06255 [Planctomycetes bacterium RBG_16_41_13]